MSTPNILVIAVDGLRAAALGAYGNTTYSTPALDDLAARSLLFDWCFVDSTDLATIYRTLWNGDTALVKSLASSGYTTTLVTDDPAVVKLGADAAFEEVLEVSVDATERAAEVDGTTFARLFGAACDEVTYLAEGPRLVWLHARGMFGPWDAPLELQEPLLEPEEGDPPPEESVAPPNMLISETSSADAAFRWSCAFAAQVMVLDACLAELHHVVDAASGNWLVVLLGTRGFSLGEHDNIGGEVGQLYAEELHVPLLIRFPNRAHGLERVGTLASLADLPLALQSALSGLFSWPTRDVLIASSSNGTQSIRTPDWSFRTEPAPTSDEILADMSNPNCELFVRPDDRWEANDVAALLPDIVDELLAKLGAGLTS